MESLSQEGVNVPSLAHVKRPPLLPRAAASWGLFAAFCKAEAKSKHQHLLFGSEHTLGVSWRGNYWFPIPSRPNAELDKF